ncbi:hypothetical protein HA145_03510 [Prochlorococcus marinus XMU1411]|uniref:hypothetical protein n=1 Tax=Prochlorococcus marinus TaxID=1219 RepID=UPI001ADA8AEE|nr:hypothetical protein [Prochlorococcus marinus]MBO8243541.1 hypothetical protein [Prochlorococcus marinus XMU1411]MBW3054656.1 hypothetical protein [Prochlorococcus marinus str. MU1411]MCR8538235.1 hypothetical protein [Prochlorococcus marinus CUG1430]
MKISKISYFLIAYLTSFTSFQLKPIHASSTILNCNSKIPKGVPCLIKAYSYNVEIEKVDICPKNPFPEFRTTPDYAGSLCLSLYDKKINSRKLNLTNNSKLEIPENNLDNREYKYISIIFKNKFTVSGKFSSNENSWNTGKKGPKNVLKAKDNFEVPKKFSEKLTNWRGLNNLDNKYCDNNGGTFSRCDLNYNGYKLTAIGLNENFIESYGEKTKYLFYNVELSPPITLNKKTKGNIDIKFQRNLEVYGDGKNIKSISVAPLILRAFFTEI